MNVGPERVEIPLRVVDALGDPAPSEGLREGPGEPSFRRAPLDPGGSQIRPLRRRSLTNRRKPSAIRFAWIGITLKQRPLLMCCPSPLWMRRIRIGIPCIVSTSSVVSWSASSSCRPGVDGEKGRPVDEDDSQGSLGPCGCVRNLGATLPLQYGSPVVRGSFNFLIFLGFLAPAAGFEPATN